MNTSKIKTAKWVLIGKIHIPGDYGQYILMNKQSATEAVYPDILQEMCSKKLVLNCRSIKRDTGVQFVSTMGTSLRDSTVVITKEQAEKFGELMVNKAAYTIVDKALKSENIQELLTKLV